MLQSLAQLCVAFLDLFEQPHVLDGDYGLGGEGLKQFDLLVSERLHLHPADHNGPNRNTFAEQRHGKHGASAST